MKECDKMNIKKKLSKLSYIRFIVVLSRIFLQPSLSQRTHKVSNRFLFAPAQMYEYMECAS